MWPCARPKPCTFPELRHGRDAVARRRRGPVGRAEDAASRRRPGHDRVLRAPRLRLSADTDYAPETGRFCLPLAIGSRKRRRSDRSAGSKRPKTLERMDWSGKPDSNRRPSAWEADALPTELFPLGAQRLVAASGAVKDYWTVSV